MRNIANYKKFIIILFILFLIDATGYYFILKPHATELKGLKKTLYNKNGNNITKDMQPFKSGESQSYTAHSREQIKKFNKALPNKEKLAHVIGELLSFVDKQDMVLKKVTYLPKQIKGTDLLDYSANFTITGDYASFKRLLNEIEWSENLYLMKKLTLKKNPENRSIELNLTLSIFLRSNKGLL